MIIILFLTVGSKPIRQFVIGVFKKSSGKQKKKKKGGKFLQRYVNNVIHFTYSQLIFSRLDASFPVKGAKNVKN